MLEAFAGVKRLVGMWTRRPELIVVVIGACLFEQGCGVEEVVCVCGDGYPGVQMLRDVSVESSGLLRCCQCDYQV